MGGTHVHLWLIRADVQQNHHNTANNYPLIKISKFILKRNKQYWRVLSRAIWQKEIKVIRVGKKEVKSSLFVDAWFYTGMLCFITSLFGSFQLFLFFNKLKIYGSRLYWAACEHHFPEAFTYFVSLIFTFGNACNGTKPSIKIFQLQNNHRDDLHFVTKYSWSMHIILT